MNKEYEELNTGSVAVSEKTDNTESELNSINSTPSTSIKVKGGRVYAFFKRIFDIFCSFFAIIILSIPMLIIGLLVKLTSKGSMIFKDYRIGKNGKCIPVLKFRTMHKDAEKRIKEYLTDEEYERWLVERKLENDPRITKLGNFLRKTSLDELPQLFNILIGQMSFVGPRPVIERELTDNYTEEEIKVLLLARPGLTGYWQVYAKGDTNYTTKKRQAMELEYFKHRGFWYDIGLIFKTIPVVLKKDRIK